MAVSKPTKYPEWADGGSAGIVEPSGAKKLLGWVVEKPPYQFFNWLFNLLYQWIEWIDQGYRPMTAVTAAGNTAVPLGASVDYAVDATLGNQTFTLPTPLTADNGMIISILRLDSSANSITWTGTISGQVNPTVVNQYTRQSIIAHAGAWYWLS